MTPLPLPPPSGYDSWLDYALDNTLETQRVVSVELKRDPVKFEIKRVYRDLCTEEIIQLCHSEIAELRTVEQAVVEFCEVEKKYHAPGVHHVPHIQALFDIAQRAKERAKP